MSNPADVIEQSVSSFENRASTRHAPIADDRRPGMYYTVLTMLACMGYAWSLLFPLASLLLAMHIPYAIYHATDALDYSLILAEFSLAMVTAVVSVELYRLNPAQPAGRPLLKHESPILHTMIEELCKKYHLNHVVGVRITRECGISSVTTPLNGYPFFHKYTLVIGLPLMQSLDARQLICAIEREIFKMAGRKKRLGSWLCYLRHTWRQQTEAWQKNWHLAGWVMRAFYLWYTPLFNMFAQTACRDEMLRADARVHRDLHDDTLPDMLVTHAVSQRFLDEYFWPHLYSKAYRHKEPPYLPYSSMDHDLRARLDSISAQAWLNAVLESHADQNDLPGLNQRLANLGIEQPVLPASVMLSAAKYFLGEQLTLIAQQMDKIWLMTHEKEWHKKHQQGVREQQRLRELAAQAVSAIMNNEQAWELLQLAKKYIPEEQTATLYKQILKCNVSDARIHFDIGRSLLAHADEDGVATLERAMSLDGGYTIMSCQLITNYYVRVGNSKSAQTYRRRALAYQVEAA
jgi:hypothetical protein